MSNLQWMSLTFCCLVGVIAIADFNINKHNKCGIFLPDLPISFRNSSKPEDNFTKSGLSDF